MGFRIKRVRYTIIIINKEELVFHHVNFYFLENSYIHLLSSVSTGHLTDLIYTEKELVQSLREYIKAEESKLAAVKRCIQEHRLKTAFHVIVASRLPLPSFSWANKLDALTRVSTSDPEGYLGHPVNAYKLMKRLNTEWTELESLVLQNPSDGREEKGNQARKG